MSDTAPLVLGTRSGDVVTLTLNRPEVMNATVPGMIGALSDGFEAAIADGARAIVLTGSGRAFCAGAYLKGDAPAGGGRKDMGEGLERILNPFLQRVMTAPVPVITALNGAAVGAGVGLALAADIVVAARSAYFMIAFAKVGLVADAGITWMLPRLVGRHRALELMYLADRLPVEQAQTMGLVNRVVEDVDLPAAALDLATRIAAGPTATLVAMRQAVVAGLQSGLPDSLALEAANQRDAGYRDDFAEGVAAFAEKRPTRFRGV